MVFISFLIIKSAYYVPYESITKAEKKMKQTFLFFFYLQICCHDVVEAKSVEERMIIFGIVYSLFSLNKCLVYFLFSF